MTSEQFEALAKRISLRGGQSEEAARRVLVGGEAPGTVAVDLGVTPQAVTNVVRRCKIALELARTAAGAGH